MKRTLILLLLALNVLLVSVAFMRMGASAARAERPAALFFASDFQAEYKASDKGWVLSDDLTYWIVKDYHGQYINFEGSYRHTVGQPERYTSSLWLVGNSTLVSAQVADKDTIASYLQAMRADVRVVNVGMGGAAVVHEYYRLRTLPIVPGDTVVFYDGVMDAEGEKFSLDQYRQYVGMARAYALTRGATFYHILQPILCTVLDSAWDRQNDADEHLCAILNTNWPGLQATETGVDFTHILDAERRSGTVIYLDAHHINEAGNVIVARAMFNLLYLII